MIKSMALLLEDNEIVYVGLNSILPLISSFMARDFYKKRIRIVGVSEAYNPKDIIIKVSSGDPYYSENSPIFPTYESFDLAQKGKLDVMFFGPAQVDEETNVNISVIGNYYKPKVRLPGGAATAFLMPLVKKVILWNFEHSKRVLVKKVDFVTGTAKFSNNQVYLVTSKCVMKYDRNHKKWKIVKILNKDIKNIVENTSFEVLFDNNLQEISLTDDEIRFINSLDPYNLRHILEF
jgi:glutaconate CoA-transferase subunit B